MSTCTGLMNTSAASKLSLARIKRLLSSHRITRFSAEEVKNVLQTPALNLAKGAAEAASDHVLLLLPQATLLDQRLREVGRRIKQVLKTLEQIIGNPDVAIMLSIPGVGPGITATFLSEAWRQIRERDCNSALFRWCSPGDKTKCKAKDDFDAASLQSKAQTSFTSLGKSKHRLR